MHPQDDHFVGGFLHMKGETNHAADARLLNVASIGDRVHLFYRGRHHEPFTYYGEVHLDRRGPTTPAGSCSAPRWARPTRPTCGRTPTKSSPLRERPRENKGTAVVTTYRLSLRNRAEALRVHGRVGGACGFDFDAAHGPGLARGYVEFHHWTSVTKLGGRIVDLQADLAPLCANSTAWCTRRTGKSSAWRN